MPIQPNASASSPAPKVDVNLREHLSFNPASQETIQRTNLAKSFLEDYYKQIPVRQPKVEEETEEDDKKRIKKSSSNKKIKAHQPASPQITRPFSVMHHAHVGFAKGSGLQVQNLPNDLREFVEDLNASLGRAGAEDITEEELKMVLSSAKLPHSASAPAPLNSQPPLPRNDEEVVDIHQKIDSNMNSIIDTFTPPSSPSHPSSSSSASSSSSSSSASTPAPSSSGSLGSSSSSISSASSTPTLPASTPQKKPAPSHPPPPYPTYPSTPTQPADGRDSMNVNVGKDKDNKEKEKEKEKEREKDNKPQSGGERNRAPSRTRKFTQFFTGKPSPKDEAPAGKRLSRSLSESSSKTTKTEPLHQTHGTPQKPAAHASPAPPAQKPAAAPAQKPAAAVPPLQMGFERATPKAAKAANFEISSPRNFAKVGGFDFGGESMKDMKVKLELADKALMNENQLRLASEEKTANLEKTVTELKVELEHAKNQANTFKALLEEANTKFTASTSWHKQADSEINMLRRKIAIKTKSEEDTIASESKKRRLLEVQIVELKAQIQQLQKSATPSAAKATTNDSSSMTTLVADVKAQLANADAELQLVKGQLNDERNRAQEENENLRKELDAAKTSFEEERKSWIETRLRLEAMVEKEKAEAMRKVDEITKLLEEERKQRKVDQMMFETLLKNNNENPSSTSPSPAISPSPSPSTSPPQSPTQSPVSSPQLTSTAAPTTSIPPISPLLSDSASPQKEQPKEQKEQKETQKDQKEPKEEEKVVNPRYSSPLPPGPPSRPPAPTTAHPSTPGFPAGTNTTPKPAIATTTKQPKAKDGQRSFFRSGKK